MVQPKTAERPTGPASSRKNTEDDLQNAQEQNARNATFVPRAPEKYKEAFAGDRRLTLKESPVSTVRRLASVAQLKASLGALLEKEAQQEQLRRKQQEFLSTRITAGGSALEDGEPRRKKCREVADEEPDGSHLLVPATGKVRHPDRADTADIEREQVAKEVARSMARVAAAARVAGAAAAFAAADTAHVPGRVQLLQQQEEPLPAEPEPQRDEPPPWDNANDDSPDEEEPPPPTSPIAGARSPQTNAPVSPAGQNNRANAAGRQQDPSRPALAPSRDDLRLRNQPIAGQLPRAPQGQGRSRPAQPAATAAPAQQPAAAAAPAGEAVAGPAVLALRRMRNGMAVLAGSMNFLGRLADSAQPAQTAQPAQGQLAPRPPTDPNTGGGRGRGNERGRRQFLPLDNPAQGGGQAQAVQPAAAVQPLPQAPAAQHTQAAAVQQGQQMSAVVPEPPAAPPPAATGLGRFFRRPWNFRS